MLTAQLREPKHRECSRLCVGDAVWFRQRFMRNLARLHFACYKKGESLLSNQKGPPAR
jgi:hypothetical protein